MFKIDITYIKNKEYLFTLSSAISPNNEELSSEELTLMLDQLMIEIINFDKKIEQDNTSMRNVKIRGETKLVPKITKVESTQLSSLFCIPTETIESLSTKKKIKPIIASIRRYTINGVVNRKKHWTEYLPETSFNPHYRVIKHMKFDFSNRKLFSVVLRNARVALLHQIQFFHLVDDLKPFIKPTIFVNTLDDDNIYERNERLEMREITQIKKMTIDEKINHLKQERIIEEKVINTRKNSMIKDILDSILNKINYSKKIIINSSEAELSTTNKVNHDIKLDKNKCYAYIKGSSYTKSEYEEMINKRKQQTITYETMDETVPKEVGKKLEKAIKNHEIQSNTKIEYMYKNRTYEYYINGKQKQFSKRQKWKEKRHKNFRIRNFETQVKEQSENLKICSRFLKSKGVGFSKHPINFGRITRLSKKILNNAKRVANLITAGSNDECAIPLVSWVGVFWHVIYKNVLQNYQ